MTLGGALTALLVRMTRASLLDVLREPFVTVARAKGLSESTVLFKHALRNALLPVVTIAGSQLGALLGGALIIEKIFERPGLGSLFLEAFSERDLPVLQGCVLVMALGYVVVNVAVDLAYTWIDPRIRLA
jgi:peptide/nickel transport system permease protein